MRLPGHVVRKGGGKYMGLVDPSEGEAKGHSRTGPEGPEGV